MVQRKGSTRVLEDAEELVHVPLQAILLADSFAQKFRPITLERPKVINYLENSHWFSLPHFDVTTIESHNFVSAGDALRLIFERHVIHEDFILITGDTVSNMSLT
ncbi:translation initiation factor eIF-2B subunit epsilon-like isoform X1 [Vitis riparia]|uniref:translation initiation factor eIF-2B subunit epsilon-like isoform X1 n=1 Tax=Vitis riparia TaxID=96939 RepID=UPI00155AD86E|nr:translation initiation factor eIF-2B subunit epsilon-like isoform X1 [Vitis riparia]